MIVLKLSTECYLNLKAMIHFNFDRFYFIFIELRISFSDCFSLGSKFEGYFEIQVTLVEIGFNEVVVNFFIIDLVSIVEGIVRQF